MQPDLTLPTACLQLKASQRMSEKQLMRCSVRCSNGNLKEYVLIGLLFIVALNWCKPPLAGLAATLTVGRDLHGVITYGLLWRAIGFFAPTQSLAWLWPSQDNVTYKFNLWNHGGFKPHPFRYISTHRVWLRLGQPYCIESNPVPASLVLLLVMSRKTQASSK